MLVLSEPPWGDGPGLLLGGAASGVDVSDVGEVLFKLNGGDLSVREEELEEDPAEIFRVEVVVQAQLDGSSITVGVGVSGVPPPCGTVRSGSGWRVGVVVTSSGEYLW